MTEDTQVDLQAGTQWHAALMVKTDAQGEIVWERILGGGEADGGFCKLRGGDAGRKPIV